MKRRKLPAEVVDLYRKLKDDNSMNLTTKGKIIMEQYPDHFVGILPRSAYVACQREDDNDQAGHLVAEARETLPTAVDLPPILDEVVWSYQDCLLFSDNHLPFHDSDVIAEGMAFAKAQKLRRVVLNGDTLDLHWASKYVNLSGEDSEASFRQLADYFVALMDHGLREIVLDFGNHEDRITRATDGRLHLWSIVAMAIDTLPSRDRMRVRKAVTATNRPYITLVDTPDGTNWVIGHPRRYRQKRLSLAADLALKTFKCHVATGHEHHIGVTVSDCGDYWAMNLPCTQAAERTEYLQMDMSPTPRPIKGFGWLIDGVPGVWWEKAAEQWKRKQLKAKSKQLNAKKGKR